MQVNTPSGKNGVDVFQIIAAWRRCTFMHSADFAPAAAGAGYRNKAFAAGEIIAGDGFRVRRHLIAGVPCATT